MSELREWLAALAHEQWSGWTEYMLDNMDDVHIKGWRRQIATSYDSLSESEKRSDRKEADRVLRIIGKFGSREIVNAVWEATRKSEEADDE